MPPSPTCAAPPAQQCDEAVAQKSDYYGLDHWEYLRLFPYKTTQKESGRGHKNHTFGSPLRRMRAAPVTKCRPHRAVAERLHKSRIIVPMTETKREPTQPRRFEKKANTRWIRRSRRTQRSLFFGGTGPTNVSVTFQEPPRRNPAASASRSQPRARPITRSLARSVRSTSAHNSYSPQP